MTSRKMSQQQTSNETLSSRRDTESHRQLSVPGRVISASAPAVAACGAPPGPGPPHGAAGRTKGPVSPSEGRTNRVTVM